MQPIAGTGTAALAFGLAALIAASGCGPTPPLRPNLVLITLDAVRPDWLVCYDASAERGSDACGLAERGALYEWAFTTAPSGAPAAASLLSSTYPSQHGVRDEPSSFLPYLGPPVVAEILRGGGYATAAFVDSPELNRSRAFDRGFDRYEDLRSRAGVPEAATLVERLRGWTRSSAAPFFVWIHLGEAHGPFATRDRRRYREEYAAALRRLDAQVGRALAWLESDVPDAGILLTALHGQGLGEARGSPLGHGSSLAPSQIRIPLLWRSPRVGAGPAPARRVAGVVSLIDVAPTLLEAAGLASPASFEGRPLPHSDGGAADASRRTVFAELPDAVAVIQDGGVGVFPRLLVPAPGQPAAGDASATAEHWYRFGSAAAAPGAGAAASDRAPASLESCRAELGRLPLEWRRADDRETAPAATESARPAP